MDEDYYDYAYEKHIEDMFATFREEHGDDIAHEVSIDEVRRAATAAHVQWVDRTHETLARSLKRLSESEYDEAAFHAGRALDGYFNNVLVEPLRAVLLERFAIMLPAGFPAQLGSFFKNVRGFGDKLPFAAYTLSVLSERDVARDLIDQASRLTKGNDNLWEQRNRLFHAPVALEPDAASALVQQCSDLIDGCIRQVDAILAEREAAVAAIAFAPTRLVLMASLALIADADRALFVDTSVPGLPWNERAEALVAFERDGLIERENSEPFFSKGIRLTDTGREIFATSFLPRMDDELNARAAAIARAIRQRHDSLQQ